MSALPPGFGTQVNTKPPQSDTFFESPNQPKKLIGDLWANIFSYIDLSCRVTEPPENTRQLEVLRSTCRSFADYLNLNNKPYRGWVYLEGRVGLKRENLFALTSCPDRPLFSHEVNRHLDNSRQLQIDFLKELPLEQKKWVTFLDFHHLKGDENQFTNADCFPNVENLNFNERCEISPAFLSLFPKLTHLSISNSPTLAPEALDQISSLETLKLFHQPIQEDQLRDLIVRNPELKTLSIGHCENLTEEGWDQLAPLLPSSLTRLDLSRTNIRLSTLITIAKRCLNLTHLTVSDSTLTRTPDFKESIPQLALKELNLMHTTIEMTDLIAILNHSPNLEVLMTPSVPIAESIDLEEPLPALPLQRASLPRLSPEKLAAFIKKYHSTLIELNIQTTKDIPKDLPILASLQNLTLQANSDQDVLTMLSKCPRLETLYFHSSRFTGNSFAGQLPSLASLRTIRLDGASISDKGMDALLTAYSSSLKKVYCRGCQSLTREASSSGIIVYNSN